MPKCEACDNWNAHIVRPEGMRMLLCNHCIEKLKILNAEYIAICGNHNGQELDVPTQIPFSSHKGKEDA